MVHVNWLALLAAVAVNMVVGFVWYSKLLFAKDWSKLVGRKMEEMGDGTKGYIITTVGAFLQAYVMLHFVVMAKAFYPGYTNLETGLLTGLWAWLGFTFVPQLVNTVFANTRKKLLAINTGYFLVVFLINGVLLACWR